MQQVYSKDNITNNFWGCYARVQLHNDQLILDNTLTDKRIILVGNAETLAELRNSMDNGMSDEHLRTLLMHICQNSGRLMVINETGAREAEFTAFFSAREEIKNVSDSESKAMYLLQLMMQEGMIE